MLKRSFNRISKSLICRSASPRSRGSPAWCQRGRCLTEHIPVSRPRAVEPLYGVAVVGELLLEDFAGGGVENSTCCFREYRSHPTRAASCFGGGQRSRSRF